MTHTFRLLLVALLVVAGAAVGVSTATAAPASCPASWGSLARSSPDLGQAQLVDVRAGRHRCYDRLVFDLAGPAAGYSVGYVREVTADGSGEVVPVPGGARLQVVLHHPSYDDRGAPTYPRPGQAVPDVRGFSTLRAVVPAGSFEGYTTLGVGVRARLPFRVFVLDGPGGHSRIVLDVAHRWSAGAA